MKRGRRGVCSAVATASGILGLLLAVTLIPVSRASTVTDTTSLKAGFNGNAIKAGDTVWFQAVVQWVGTHPSVLTNIHLYPENITIAESSGTQFHLNLPGALVTYSPGATTATTVWNSTSSEWVTTVPASYSGDVFASGVPFLVPAGGLSAGAHVTWWVNFHSSEGCLSFNWKFAAAVYTDFPHWGSYGKIGVKPVDSNSLSVYKNSHHAGTPENYTAYVTGGAMGGGGSNFTGSYSGTGSVRGGSCPGQSH